MKTTKSASQYDTVGPLAEPGARRGLPVGLGAARLDSPVSRDNMKCDGMEDVSHLVLIHD